MASMDAAAAADDAAAAGGAAAADSADVDRDMFLFFKPAGVGVGCPILGRSNHDYIEADF